jgi:phenylpropionate dioxygenase-like ring-hydroxylating dioxygenase large terminal subunit
MWSPDRKDDVTTAASLIAPPAECTFDAADWQILARCWFPIALSREIQDAPVACRLLDVQLVAYRAGGEVVVAQDVCPHRGVPLSVATANGSGITCAYHGLQFGAGGACLHIPANPDGKIPNRLHLKPFPVVERYGLVWTCLDTEAEADIPVLPHWYDDGFQQITCPAFDVAAFAGRQVEGFIDVAHFAFVHTDTFADPDDSAVPNYLPVDHEKGFSADYWSSVSNYPHGTGIAPPGFQWLRRFDVHLPFTATLVVHFPDDKHLSIMNAASPVSALQTRMFAPIAKDFLTDQPVEEVYDFNARIFEEDRRIVEVQRPENLPLDPKIEVNIPADRSSVAYRRGLRSLGLSHFFTA